MLSFDIRSLERTAAHVDAQLAPDDPIWEERDPLPFGSITVRGRLSSAGDGRFYFSGHLEGGANLPCRRCLEEVDVAVNEEAHFIFAETGADAADDPDVFQYDPHATSLDLRPAVRESWLLIAPAYVQCRDDCRGLCPKCGTNLNESTCNCVADTGNSTWDALKKLGKT